MTENSCDITLFIDPPSHHFQKDALFDIDRAKLTGDNILAPYAYIQNWFAGKGIRVHTADRLVNGEICSACNVYVSLGILNNYRALARRRDVVLSGFFAIESPIVEPSLYRGLKQAQRYFKRIFSWSDSRSLERFIGVPLRLESFRWPQSFDQVHEKIWSQTDRKFIVMINSNKLPRVYWRELYTERLRAVDFFSRTGEIDLYGIGWDGPSYRLGKTWVPYTFRRAHRMLLKYWQRFYPDRLLEAVRLAYRGPALSKAETLGRYTFSICFENMILKGWITEKIFDCFFAGTIPVYLGAPDIGEHIPPECFIDMRHFKNYGELRSYLKSLDEKDIITYKERARDFLGSEKFKPFRMESFANLFKRIVEEDLNIHL